MFSPAIALSRVFSAPAFLFLVISLWPALESPAQDQTPVLGEGFHRFSWQGEFFRLPEKTTWGNTHGNIVVDRQGRIYVNTDTERAVIVFKPDGTFLKSWGKELKGGLHGMTLVREGKEEFLYLAHAAKGEILKTTLEGKVLWRMGTPDIADIYAKKTDYHPTSIAVASNGDFFVGDGYGKSVVLRYSKDRKLLGTFGGWGGEPGKMRVPHGLYIDRYQGKEELLVADRENGRLQRFSLEGKFIEQLKGPFRRPCSVHGHKDLLVVADLAGRVTVLDRKRRLVVQLGDQPDPKKRAQNGIPSKDWKPGEFISPHYACFGPKGEIFVMDWLREGRVSKLSRVPSVPKSK